MPVEEPSSVPLAYILTFKLVTLMRTMLLDDNSRHQLKRWFGKEV
jgi:hypothetical protein